jgi:hypothetical protein
MNEEVPSGSIDGWLQQGAGWWIYPLTKDSVGFPKTLEYLKDILPLTHAFGFSILFQNSMIKMHTDPMDLELVSIEGHGEGSWVIMDGRVFSDEIRIPHGTEWGQINMTENSVVSLYYFLK